MFLIIPTICVCTFCNFSQGYAGVFFSSLQKKNRYLSWKCVCGSKQKPKMMCSFYIWFCRALIVFNVFRQLWAPVFWGQNRRHTAGLPCTFFMLWDKYQEVESLQCGLIDNHSDTPSEIKRCPESWNPKPETPLKRTMWL